ncbi:MAG: hypothetical protein PHE78_06850 [Candidatus Gastranaerophilales bacterium]|nr:hypothetical protein [Candidatus Gastranaerophilales bacterium]
MGSNPRNEDFVIIPEFLLRRIYRAGSLRITDEGIAIDLKNMLGPGVISGIGFVEVNGEKHTPEELKLITSGQETTADAITPDNPVIFRLHQEGTLILQGVKELNQGINRIILELISKDAGKVQVSLNENFMPA